MFQSLDDLLEKPLRKQTALLALVLIVASALGGYAFLEKSARARLEDGYLELHDQSTALNTYYQELQTRYNESMEDYEELNRNYTKVLKEYQDLKKEYFDVINHKKNLILEEDREITLKGGDNVSLNYSIPASGYIELEYESTEEIYLWIGSTIQEEGYYARYPAFPDTATSASVKIPVSPDLVVFIGNPNTGDSLVNLNINLIY
jgi:uncharacterized membrane-anchored protein YhcB (DUF1043 family)